MNAMSEAKLLLVEDEEKLIRLLENMLVPFFSVDSFSSYDALATLLDHSFLPYEVIVLDRMMNGKDALDLLPEFKQQFPQCRILVLSAIDTPAEKATALDQGADDYLAKPFAKEELVARIRVLARRVSNEIRFGNISINNADRTAKVGEKLLALSNKEFLLLRALIQNPTKVFNKSFLHEKVWQVSTDIESNAVETTVNKLRRKLEDASATARVKNSRNLGYWLEE